MDVHEADAAAELVPADAPEVLRAEIEQFEHGARRIAAGGWRRAVTGVALGVAAGLAAIGAIPRDRA